MNMSIEEAIQEKEHFLREITNLANQFTMKTGLTINKVTFSHVNFGSQCVRYSFDTEVIL
jgi:hypothetical protein